MVNSEWMEPSLEVEVGSGVGGLAGCLACHGFKSGTGSSQPEALLRRCHNFHLRKPASPEKTIAKTAPVPAKIWTHAATVDMELRFGVELFHARGAMEWLRRLNSAVNGTSNKPNGVSTLDTGFADPDMEALRQKVNEIILNGRR
jgi:hypothetical protein